MKPEWFDINPTVRNATKLWRHWLATFENFLAAIECENLNKLTVLTNYVSADIYELFGEAANYDGDTFIRGLQNGSIRQHLLENERLDLQAAFTQARALDTAQRNADLYKTHVTAVADLTPPPSVPPLESDHSGGESASCAALKRPNCYFCGFT